VTSMTFYLNTR